MPKAKKAVKPKKAVKAVKKTVKKAVKKVVKKVVKKPAKKGAAKAVKKTMKKTVAKKTVKASKPAKKAVKKSVKKTVKKVMAIPKGYNSITPYLIVDHGVNAIEFYKKAFGAKEVMRMEKEGGKIGHAELQIGDSRIMLADEHPDCGACATHEDHDPSVSIHLYIKDVDAVVERAVAAGAIVIRPTEDMFYGDRSAGLEDPFGHQWFVSTHVEDVSPSQMKKRIEALCAAED